MHIAGVTVRCLAGTLLLCLAGGVWAQGPPVAVDDGYVTPAGDNLSVDAPGVLSNDSDPDEDPLEAYLVDGPASGGVVNLFLDGSFEYEPPPAFQGVDTFTYFAHDGTSASNEATVSITVTLGGGRIVYFDEAAFVAALTVFGAPLILEGFEDDAAWGAVRSTIPGGQHTAPSVESQGLTWTSNNDVSEVTTGPGPARTGEWGFFTLPHGNYATGTGCDVPGNCTDGFRAAATSPLIGVGGWIEGNFGKIEFFLDGDTANPVSFGDNAGLTNAHKFFGVIDTGGFTTFEVHETEGTAGDQKIIFADDFTFGEQPTGILLSVTQGPLPGEVTLEWTGGQPDFSVFRSTVAATVTDPANKIAETADSLWVDAPPPANLYYYRVTGQ